MKKINTNLEVLLQPGSSFFQRDWCELNSMKNEKNLSQKEQLAKLCWNGMLTEILPEILETRSDKKPLILWKINDWGNLLDLRFGEFDNELNDEWSVNPYIFLNHVILS